MIENKRQFEVTQKKLADLKRAVEEKRAQTRPVAVPEKVWRGHQNGIRALMSDLQAELEAYERLQSDTVRPWPEAGV